MAQPSTIIYPESKTLPSEVKIAQANVYKIMLECWNRDPLKRPTFEFLTHMFEDFNITTQNQYMEWRIFPSWRFFVFILHFFLLLKSFKKDDPNVFLSKLKSNCTEIKLLLYQCNLQKLFGVPFFATTKWNLLYNLLPVYKIRLNKLPNPPLLQNENLLHKSKSELSKQRKVFFVLC